MNEDFYKSPWDTQMRVDKPLGPNRGPGYYPAIPLPLFLLCRKQCECGQKFWRLSSYQIHWQISHSTVGYVYWEPDGSGGAY